MDADDLDPEPLRQLEEWLDEARSAGETMPEAMCVATASSDGAPSVRMVLLRGLDTGLVFYTDYGSQKASDIASNPRAEALFHIRAPVHRQVRVSGTVERTTSEESDRYWQTRPVESRRSAVISRQSTVVRNRADLERAVAALDQSETPVRPDRWGGYRITPRVVEFWQEGSFRLHDRIRYRAVPQGWRVERLAP